ncbi:MAG: hypothetical protein AAF797_14210 [Planctomycetota bacterium]
MRPTPPHIARMLDEASRPGPLDHPLPRRAWQRVLNQLRDLASVLQPLTQYIFRPFATGTVETASEIRQHARKSLAKTGMPAFLSRHLPTAFAVLLLVAVFFGMSALRPDPVAGSNALAGLPASASAATPNDTASAYPPNARTVAYQQTQHRLNTPVRRTTPAPTPALRSTALPPLLAAVSNPPPINTTPTPTRTREPARAPALAQPTLAIAPPTLTSNQAPAANTTPVRPTVAAPPTTPTQAQAQAQAGEDLPPVVFLIDASGSMVDVLPKAHGWLAQRLDDLPTGQPFTVILFSADTLAEPQHPDGPSRGLRPANPSARDAALRWLTTTGPQIANGRSDPQAALGTALAYAPGTLVIASDDGFAQRSMWGTGPGLHAAIDQLVASQADPQTLTIDTAQFLYRSVDGTLEALASRFAGSYTFIPDPPVNTARQLIPLY